MRVVLFALLIILPTTTLAEGSPNSDYSFFSSFIQMIAVLAIVLGLIFLIRHFSEKLLGGVTSSRAVARHIRLLETRYIAPKKALVLIEVGGEYLLLSSTENKLSLIKKIDMLEDIEVVEEPEGGQAGLAGLLRRYSGKRNG